MTDPRAALAEDEDSVSWWSQDADGRSFKVTIVGGWEEPYEAEFAAWKRLPWWKKLMAQFGWWL